MAYVVTEACVDVQDRSCIPVCPADCIFEGRRMTYINPDLCIDCGACVSACPVEAIFYDAELPADQELFLELNEQFFGEISAPKSGRKAGKIDHDVEFVTALADRRS